MVKNEKVKNSADLTSWQSLNSGQDSPGGEDLWQSEEPL